jgi:hypothetical protein
VTRLSLPLTLETIPEERRRPEAELWGAFEAERPRILGAPLDAVARGLRGCCHAWPISRYGIPIGMAVIGDVVTAAIRTMMTERTEPWVGTSSELLTLLTSAGGESISQTREALRGRLQRAAPLLRQIAHPGRVWRQRTGAQERYAPPTRQRDRHHRHDRHKPAKSMG